MSDNKKMMEIAEKIIKEYSKDFNTDIIDIYRVDFDNMKALCDKEFENNGIKTDYEYQSVDALSQKRDFIYKSTENPIRRNNNIPCYVVGWG